MAKDILSMLEELTALGIELTEDQRAKVEEAKVTAFTSKAVTIFDRKVSDVADESDEDKATRVSEWADDMISFASRVSDGIVSKEVAKGRGFVSQHLFGIDTPNGHLRVELTRPVSK